MASTQEASRFGEGPMTQLHSHFRSVRKLNLEYVQRARKKMQRWESRRTEQRIYFLRTTRFPRQQLRRPNECMEPSLIAPTSVTICPKVHQPQHNHRRMDQLKHGTVVVKTIGGTSHKTRGIKQTIVSHGDMIPQNMFSRRRIGSCPFALANWQTSSPKVVTPETDGHN